MRYCPDSLRECRIHSSSSQRIEKNLLAQGHTSLQGHLHPMTYQLGVPRPRILIPIWDSSEEPSQLQSFSWGQLRPTLGLYHSSTFLSAQSCSHPSLPHMWILKEVLHKYPYAKLHLRVFVPGNPTCNRARHSSSLGLPSPLQILLF